jgi:hypothetical protein
VLASISFSPRLGQLCDEAIARLERAIQLLKDIKAKDTASGNAAAWLRDMTRFVPFEGDVLCVPMEPVFVELEAMEADQVFGPRDDSDGEDDLILTADPPHAPADCR